MNYSPEGTGGIPLADFYSINALKAAMRNRAIYEGTVTLCDSRHNLYVRLGGITGMMPRTEGALGILEGNLREVALLSRVGKRVCFHIIGFQRNADGTLLPVLSRRSAQLRCLTEYIDKLTPGDIIPAKVTRLEGFGAFIDIGCGITSLIPIDMLSVSRIRHPSDRLRTGSMIKAVLKSRGDGKLTFSLRELLGTWEENAARFAPGDTVTGIVRSVESYGAFVELMPNLAGLTDSAEDLEEGEAVSVYIKSVNPEKMKLKLSVVERLGKSETPPLTYFYRGAHMDRWDYSPKNAEKKILSLF